MMRRHIAVWMQTEDDEEAAGILRVAAARLLEVGSEAAGEILRNTDGDPCGEIKVIFVGVPS